MKRAKGPRGKQPDLSQSPEDAALSKRLHELDRRLDESRAEREKENRPEPDRPGIAMAMRLGADFVAGVVLGAALGWGFDKLFGTTPWGLIVFLLLGFAAGTLSVMRSAGLVAKKPGIDDPISKKFE